MEEQQEIKIYKNYRAALRTHRSRGEGYPARARQFARKVTVERYGVSYAEVKGIVRKYDAINGITHFAPEEHGSSPIYVNYHDDLNQL